MTETHKCHACHGTKKLMGMGMITKDCYVCDGVGHLVAPATAAPAPVVVEPTPHPDVVAAHMPTPRVDKRSKAYRDSRATTPRL